MCAALMSEDPNPITHVINFELVQPICSRYVNVQDRQTDGQTDDIRQQYRASTTFIAR